MVCSSYHTSVALIYPEYHTLSTIADEKPGLTRLYLIAARLHLHAFYLFDDLTSKGYLERMVTLIGTASSLIEHTIDHDTQHPGFMAHIPFSAYQSLVCAAFVLLKVLRSEYYADLTSQTLGTTMRLFNASIDALRTMSVSKNDLPGRLSDVLAYLYSHPNPRVVCAAGEAAFQLNIQSRLSMSIVYDSLWRWRDQFVSGRASSNGGAVQSRGEFVLPCLECGCVWDVWLT